MLLLRFLTFPIAMFAFAVLYTLAIKAPAAAEIGSLVLWVILPLLVIGRVVRDMVQNATVN